MPGTGTAFALTGLFLLCGFATAVAGAVLLKLWLIDQTLDVGFAIALLFVVFLATGGVMMTKQPILLIGWSFFVVIGCMLLEPLGEKANKRGLARLAEEDIEKYKRTLEFDPNNSAAHRLLAEIYYKQDRYDEAIDEYKAAIKLNPHDVQALRRKLNYVLELREEKRGAKAPVPTAPPTNGTQAFPRNVAITMCPACRRDTPSEGKTCVHCGAHINLNFGEWLLRPENHRDIIRQTAIAMLVAMILLTVFTALPLEVKGVVIIASLIVAAFYFLKSGP